ncbi:MAG: hypothetical protein U5R06_04390 [candidate division KSB1 bacterium]|nr:hypothetical protein [candidate division KSB1 bacterium]
MQTVMLVIAVAGVGLLLWIVALLKKIKEKQSEMALKITAIAKSQTGEDDNGDDKPDPAAR